MKNILIVSIILTTFVVSLLSCGDTSGPLDVSDPTASILTVTLEETDAIKDNETTVSSALSEECSDRSEVTIERNSKGGFQAHAVWTQCPDDNFAWYAIYRSDTPGIPSNIEAADTSVIFTSVSGTSWLDTGIIAGNTYYYAVRTVNEDDIDSWSNEDSVVVSAATPPSPSTLSGSYTGDDTFGQITLEWTECPDSDFYCYKLYRSESHNIENDPSLAEIVAVAEGSNNTNFEDNDVEGLTTYYYAVETINESQLSTWSNEVSVAIPDLTPLLTVFFIDPSHNNYYSGDVILLRTPENYYYLIDGGDRSGSWSCGVEEVLPILDSLGVDSLDGIVGTHPHSDHIGGLIGVLDSVPVTTVWDSGFSYSTSTYLEYLQAIFDNGADYITPRRGDILDWDDSLTVECIHPVEPLGTNPNNASIVLRVTYGSVSFLFTGDLETSGGENVILDALNQGIIDDISADVLKVGHHGSYTSTSHSWLQAVDPNYAAIEVGYGNSYGHPHSEVIQRIENYGAFIYRTDQDGTFIMTTDGTDLEVYP
ncbi:MAG: MBL fold metallo-hydrolase [Candidatus Aegiribacteria sp.]|nr:MBL fold metallo-hydrolase [Candidatus Aegiribacteria sp.]